jgi:hypothetical protein
MAAVSLLRLALAEANATGRERQLKRDIDASREVADRFPSWLTTKPGTGVASRGGLASTGKLSSRI